MVMIYNPILKLMVRYSHYKTFLNLIINPLFVNRKEMKKENFLIIYMFSYVEKKRGSGRPRAAAKTTRINQF